MDSITKIRHWLANHEYAKAHPLLQQLLAEDPLNIDVIEWFVIASVNLGDEQARQALEVLNRSVNSLVNHVKLHTLRGNLHLHLNNAQMAVEDWRALISVAPKNHQYLYELGLLYSQLDDQDQAIISFTKAIELNPALPQAFNDRGLSHKKQGRLEEATADFEAAIALAPNFGKPIVNLGNIRQAQRNYPAALALYEKAAAIEPRSPTIYKNMGAVFRAQNHLDRARACFEKALSLDPSSASILLDITVTQQLQGDFHKALLYSKRAIAADPDNPQCWYHFGRLLQETVFSSYNAEISDLAFKLLGKNNVVRPKDLTAVIVSLLRFNPEIQICLELRHQPSSLEGFTLLCRTGSRHPLLYRAMALLPFADMDFEHLFANARTFVLLNHEHLDFNSRATFDFIEALILQCDTNEYVYFVTNEETERLADLELRLTAPGIATNESEQLKTLLVYALYRNPFSIRISDELDAAVRLESANIHQRLFANPRTEAKLIDTIPTISTDIHGTSAKVKSQYEANPYPRWINTEIPINAYRLEELVADLNLKPPGTDLPSSPTVLIAGCGTGQHSISTACRIANAKVTAIDLSYRSLVYALRKSNEHQIRNIEYIQGDIVDVQKLHTTFDVIESVGVLHHMENPVAGLSALSRILKRGGLFKIGLYSKLARKQIQNFRDRLGNSDNASESLIRELRQSIIGKTVGGSEDFTEIVDSADFYSLSDCRDLLFHVQEHNFTLPEIQALLEQHQLEFIGFEALSPTVTLDFVAQHSRQNLYSLTHWARYEADHPRIFAGMYQFWAVKL